MREGTIHDFLELVVQTPTLAQEFGELAAKYDFKFVREELSDEQLDGVSGGMFPASTKGGGGGGMSLGFPDVCYTPKVDVPSPTPYPTIGVATQTKDSTEKVSMETKDVFTTDQKG